MEINHKPVEKEFTRSGCCFTQLMREGEVAIYHKYGVAGLIRPKDVDMGFEVIQISRHDGYEIAGNQIEPAEMYPSAEQWGTKGWTFETFLRAKRAYARLLKGEHPLGDREPEPDSEETDSVPTVTTTVVRGGGRGRPRVERDLSSIVIPQGEFTMLDIAEANGMDKLSFYQIAKQFKEENKIKEVRREARGRGRPTVIFSKVEQPA